MKRKSIAFISYSLTSGGAERILTTLANEFCDDYEIFIITLTDCRSFYQLDQRIKHLNCGLAVDGKTALGNKLKQYYKVIKKLSQCFKSNNIDIAISFMTTANIFSIVATKLNKIPVIISERNNPVVNPPNRFWKYLRDRSYRFTSHLVVQTNANKKYFEKIVPTKNIKVIPNLIGRSLGSKRKLPRDIGENKIILSVGRLDQNKSQDLLIKAFANIPNDGWQVQLLGEGSARDDYEAVAKKLCVREKVSFLGNCINVWDYYNQATIFVFTSKSEGFPNALVEALYYGVPSISTNCPYGPEELITPDENGFLIPVGDQKSLENKLGTLMDHPDMRSKFSNNAIISSQAFEADIIKSVWHKYIAELVS